MAWEILGVVGGMISFLDFNLVDKKEFILYQ